MALVFSVFLSLSVAGSAVNRSKYYRASERMQKTVFEWWYGHSSAKIVLRDFGKKKEKKIKCVSDDAVKVTHIGACRSSTSTSTSTALTVSTSLFLRISTYFQSLNRTQLQNTSSIADVSQIYCLWRHRNILLPTAEHVIICWRGADLSSATSSRCSDSSISVILSGKLIFTDLGEFSCSRTFGQPISVCFRVWYYISG
jgi:hypothetical protein